MTNFDQLKADIDTGVKEHDKYQTNDAYAYNSFTIFAIIFSSLAALNPFAGYEWATKILAGLGAILIAIEKALNFGSRWVYHREMRHGYMMIASKIYFYENLPAGFTEVEKKRIFLEIFQDYYKLKIREGEVPGVLTEKNAGKKR